MIQPRSSPTGEVRNRRITVRVSPTEKEDLRARAGTLSMGSYLRKLGLAEQVSIRRKPNQRGVVVLPACYRLAVQQLGEIYRTLGYAQQYPQVVTECRQQIKALISELQASGGVSSHRSGNQ